MSDQSLRDALEKLAAKYERAATGYGGTQSYHIYADELSGLLAAHPAEGAPVVTDEAVEAFRDWLDCGQDDDEAAFVGRVRSGLEAAAPLLGHRPLLDADEVSSWIVEAAVQFAGSSGSADACHDAVKPAVDGVMKLARPMPTQAELADWLRETFTADTIGPTWDLAAECLLIALNGAES